MITEQRDAMRMQMDNESDWSDIEEGLAVKIRATSTLGHHTEEDLEEGYPSGEIRSKHEVKLIPFASEETDKEREER